MAILPDRVNLHDRLINRGGIRKERRVLMRASYPSSSLSLSPE